MDETLKYHRFPSSFSGLWGYSSIEYNKQPFCNPSFILKASYTQPYVAHDKQPWFLLESHTLSYETKPNNTSYRIANILDFQNVQDAEPYTKLNQDKVTSQFNQSSETSYL